MAEKPVAARASDLPAYVGTDYPPPHNAPCLQRSRRALGDVFGLSQFGTNLLELPPGTWSSQRHWHERQDELVYVLEGEVVLVTNDGETTLSAGMVAGFPAGAQDGHHLINRSTSLARVLEIGTRTPEEVAYYSDIDMMVRDTPAGSNYFTKSGQPLR